LNEIDGGLLFVWFHFHQKKRNENNTIPVYVEDCKEKRPPLGQPLFLLQLVVFLYSQFFFNQRHHINALVGEIQYLAAFANVENVEESLFCGDFLYCGFSLVDNWVEQFLLALVQL
jgi:hypothetical protein